MKKLFLLTLAAALAGGSLYAQDAAAIMEKSRNRISAKTTVTLSKMVITAKSGKTTERAIKQYSKKDANGNDRMVIVFLSPAAVKDSRFLTIDNDNGVSSSWIYLPKLGKVRRIAGSEGSASFMGTDMSYDDISSLNRDSSLDVYTILREEKLNGKDCYVLQGVPKDKSYQYGKMISWVDKSNYCLYKVELFDKKDKLVKVLEISNYKDISGKLTGMQTKMSTISAKTNTVITIESIEYDSDLKESFFTTRYLEEGR